MIIRIAERDNLNVAAAINDVLSGIPVTDHFERAGEKVGLPITDVHLNASWQGLVVWHVPF